MSTRKGVQVQKPGFNVRKRRKELGLSLSDLSAVLGMDRMRIWRIEKGIQPLQAHELQDWASALKTSVRRLLA